MLKSMEPTAQDLADLYGHVPVDGSSIGNGPLRRILGWEYGRYELVKNSLLKTGRLRQGRGRGGTVRRCQVVGALARSDTADLRAVSQPHEVFEAEGTDRGNIIIGPWASAEDPALTNPPKQSVPETSVIECVERPVSDLVDEQRQNRAEIEPSRVSKMAFSRSGQIVKTIMVMTGMIRGMPIDRPLNDAEIDHCHTFVKEHWALFERSGKAGVLHDFLDAIVDVTLTSDERDHLLTALAQADEAYYDAITRHMQELHGLLGFAAADRQIEPHEVDALRIWVTDNVELSGTWPYDDIALLMDGLIEHQMGEAIQALMRYAKSFEGRSLAPSTPVSVETGEALFTSSPRPIVPGRVVCITGGSIFMPRSSIARLLASVGARWNRTPSSEVDLILVCGQGNQAWAHGNYGRKLEHVIERRRRGEVVDVVDEPTFWPLLRQAGAAVPPDVP